LEEHYRPLWRYLRFLGCSDTLAEDLVQETFIAVLARPPVLHEPGAFAAYLRSVARNKYLKARQKAKSEPAWEDLGAADAIWEPVADREDWDRYREAVKGCVDSLDDRDRVLLETYYSRKGRRKESAATSGLSEEGMKTLLRRIKTRLKSCVKGKLSHD
jgi:RNA polymerase sigma-70 factor (ECF subfamily)